jgi:hypothetical protein
MPGDELADLPFAAALRIHPGTLAPAEVDNGAHFDQMDLGSPDASGSRFLACAFTQLADMAPLLAEAMSLIVADE